jgi:hypothetical protein
MSNFLFDLCCQNAIMPISTKEANGFAKTIERRSPLVCGQCFFCRMLLRYAQANAWPVPAI